MKTTKYWLSTILMVLSINCVGCGNKNDSSKESNGGNTSTPVESISNNDVPSESGEVSEDAKVTYNDPFNYPTYEATDTFVLQNGISEYSIVIPEVPQTKELFAKEELVTFFKKATGATLNVISDRGVSFDTSKKYISIGNTNIFKESGIQVSREEVTKDGFKIVSKGNQIIICSPSDYGSLYGTYRLMNSMFNYRAYADDEIVYDTVTSILLFKYDETSIPAFEERQLGYYYSSQNETYRDRLQIRLHGDNWIYATHSHFKIMPKATYYKEHPDWYSADGTQLCLTNEEMKAEFIKNIKVSIQTHPEDEYILLGEEDNSTFCKCERCQEAVEKYGSCSGVDMVFVNSVAEEIENWLKETDPTRNLKIGTFAYLKTLQAPATYNELLKKWEANCEEVKARDNVFVFIAPLETNYSYPFLNNKNQQIKDAFEGWQAVTKQFAVWTYSANYYSYFTNFMNFSTIAKQYEELSNLGTISLIDLGAWDSGTPTFSKLRIYLASKLMWDYTLNTEDLIDDFLRNYYKDAYPSMRKYFDTTRTYLEYIRDKYSLDATCYVNYNKSEYWPQSFLNSQMKLLDEALESISNLKEDNPSLYESLANRINLESIAPRYYLLRFYQNTYTQKEQTSLIDEFEYLTKFNNVTYWAESTNRAQGADDVATFIDTLRRNVK